MHIACNIRTVEALLWLALFTECVISSTLNKKGHLSIEAALYIEILFFTKQLSV